MMMDNLYTNKDIDQFFENLREMTDYPFEKVRQLINNPTAKATHRVNFNPKLLKFITMTSAFIVGASAILLWSGSHKKVEKQTIGNSPVKVSEVNTVDNGTNPVNEKSNSGANNTNIHLNTHDTLCNIETHSSDEFVQSLPDQGYEIVNENENQNCDWPEDTVIDKSLLLVELTDEEMKAIGIARRGHATFYHNISPNGYCDWQLSCHTDSIPEEERITTYNDFFVADYTNSYFETNGPGLFYLSMDTLVPVITNNKAGHIFWYTPHKDFFHALPERYKYLESVYQNLICLKRKYPDRTFTNFLEANGISVIDPLNVLELSVNDLKKIGVIIDDQCVVFQSKNKNCTLKKCTHGTYLSGNDKDFKDFPPNPYPVAMTDIYGRRTHILKSIIERDSLSKIMDILIPIKIDLQKIVPSNGEVLICWFYPTDEFVNALPDEIKSELEVERNAIVNGDNSLQGSCTYFEVCKSTLVLNDLNIYPNPAYQTVNIEFVLDNTLNGNISLVNILGSKIKVLLPETNFSPGKNAYQVDVLDINPGIYLISIMTDEGFKTQRIIISR